VASFKRCFKADGQAIPSLPWLHSSNASKQMDKQFQFAVASFKQRFKAYEEQPIPSLPWLRERNASKVYSQIK
jgi:hypothetical protein